MSSTGNSEQEGFAAEERAAMKDHAQELKKAVRRRPATCRRRPTTGWPQRPSPTSSR